MAQIVISSTSDSSAWDDDNSVTINTVWHAFSANTWAYSSGNMSLLGDNGGTWLGAGLGDATIPFVNRNGGNPFGLSKSSGTFPMGNAFASIPVGTQGIVMGGPAEGDSWTLVAN